MRLPAGVISRVRRLRLPLSRDQAMLLMLAANELLLGVETWLAHMTSGTIVRNEWVPVLFGPAAAVLLLLAGILALRRRSLAAAVATAVFVASAAVGAAGVFFHLVRAILFEAPAGERLSVTLLVWAPPVLGPLTFALVGLLGISAAWIEDPPNSGSLVIFGRRRIDLPYSKTRAYFFTVGMGALATVISSVLDHARTDFENAWLWLATGVGFFGAVVAVALGSSDSPRRGDLATYAVAMILMILVGVLGSILHVLRNLGLDDTVIGERFLRGAPFLAPLLFSDIGTIGLIVLMDPAERRAEQSGVASR